MLINITGNEELSLFEVNEASTLIQEEAHEDANIIFGAVIDPAMGDEIRITVIATGFGVGKEAALPEPEVFVEPVKVAVNAGSGGLRPPLRLNGDPGRPVRRLGTVTEEGGEPVFRPYDATANRDEGYTMSEERNGDSDLDVPAFLRVNSK